MFCQKSMKILVAQLAKRDDGVIRTSNFAVIEIDLEKESLAIEGVVVGVIRTEPA